MVFIIIRPKYVSPSVYSLSTPTPSTLPLHLLAAATVIRRHRSSASASERRRERGKQQQRRRRATEIIIHEETSAEGSREAAEPSEQLRRAAMREPSMVGGHRGEAERLGLLEERQNDWGYSKPIVVLDIVWNLAFVSVAGAIMVMARNEHPIMPPRVWLLGYALQCVLHMVCVLVEYRRRNRVKNNRTPRSHSSRKMLWVRGGIHMRRLIKMDSPVNFILSLLTVVKTLTTFFEKNGELLSPSF
ncbi:LOW QUALITY PROTEIN: hypothetical protein HID58_075716 [Brassica napus]|uniref:RING-type E3 ubiquitin transferase n=1 Tax=Brassica napus TaxID=3708 RepID=A0ABQ7YLM4_BRANA|nr:LOW QUALITY PROTEIN: hypothetical protein HID58_075716 [Brassica napus]